MRQRRLGLRIEQVNVVNLRGVGRGSLPPLICLTGVDGCGKSTQVELLAARLGDHGLNVATVWTGSHRVVSRPIVRFGKWRLQRHRHTPASTALDHPGELKMNSEAFPDYLPESGAMFRRSRVLRRGWIDLSLLEHALEIDARVLPLLRQQRLVICDRYLYRTVVNLAVTLDLSADAVSRLLRHPAFRLVPKPTRYILLDVPAEVALSRKEDIVSPEYVQRRIPIYHLLAKQAGMPVIDATQPPDVIADLIWDIVEGPLRQRGLLYPASAIAEPVG